LRFCNNQKLLSKNSHCDSCGAKITFYNLIPVCGYTTSKGRCSNCGQKISIKYTIWELIYASTFLINFLLFKNDHQSLVIFTLLTSTMFVASVIDFETMFVYNIHIVIFGILFSAFLYVNNMLEITTMSFIMATLPLIFKFGYEFIRKKLTGNQIIVLGMGDVLIFQILFFLLDFSKVAIIMFLSGLFGVLYGLLRKCGKNLHYPFVPSIFLAVYIIFIWKFL